MEKRLNKKQKSNSVSNLVKDDVGISTLTLQTAQVDEHKHRHYELIFVLNGEVLHVVQGKKYKHSKGDCILLKPNVTHEVRSCEKGVVLRHIFISPQYFNSIISLVDDKYDIFNKNDTAIFNFNRSEIIDLEEIIGRFSIENTDIRKRCLGAEILLKVIDKALSSEVNKSSFLPPLVKKICDNLNRDIYIKGGIKFILSDLMYSNSYVCHTFKKYMGVTLSEYLKEVRVNHIAYYLKTTDYSLKEICELVGISSLSYANKIFKEKYGMTPIVYKKTNTIKEGVV